MSVVDHHPPTAPPAAPGPGPGATRPHRRTLARPTAAGLSAATALLLCVIGGVWAFIALRLNIATLADSADNAVAFLPRTLPLDFPPAGELFSLIWQTLAIVVSATVLSVVLSVPLALLAARNTTPGTAARLASRGVIVLCRAVPEVVFAIAAFRVFGLGGMTGVVALGVHSVGMVGKLYADAVEQTDEGPRTALRATGAGRLQQITAAVLPQALPSLVATALHRLDINLRASAVLGFVGVNGLGYALSTAITTLDYQRAMAIALVLLLLCFVAESISGAIRRTLLQDVTAARRPRRRRPERQGARRVERPGDTAPSRPSSGAPAATTAIAIAVSPADGGTAVRRSLPRWDARRIRRTTWLVLTVALVVASAVRSGLSWNTLRRGAESFFPTVGDFLPPGTGGIGDQLWADLWVTLQIALAGTLIGLVLALPLGTLAARNVVGSPRAARFFRTVILLVRAIPELVLAIVFVVVTGLGAVSGALALGVGSVGLLGKLVADSLEETAPGPARALVATGARRHQVFFGSVLPRAWPAVVGHLLYQLDVNLRSATLLGIVGAGGIGYDLLNAARVLQFPVVTTIVLMVLALVLLIEGLAVWVRKVYA
ncbi:phosphonate ABC transporter, permease protein PhnE [Streptomyces violaceusniger]|uniref:Phosphonate ABC transporter, inner membrane subunit n=1 Tax=Streptomyces violaceusniger (strain Tu 4113) TaxID=653045 RepID=G2NV93_STRV4|nr:phosphonate ABC transporter, permease protein PhnE [Streptomyces violaceusniger]AEM85435.1 phosphonate ABC transporter, inner membrane subunit [Streptomyces violaceusniger Tu 4113]